MCIRDSHETGGLGVTSGNVKKFNPKARFSTKGHTASMVPVFSIGLGSKKFSGIYDNTEIFNKMKSQIE